MPPKQQSTVYPDCLSINYLPCAHALVGDAAMYVDGVLSASVREPKNTHCGWCQRVWCPAWRRTFGSGALSEPMTVACRWPAGGPGWCGTLSVVAGGIGAPPTIASPAMTGRGSSERFCRTRRCRGASSGGRAAEAASVLKTAACDPRQASVEVARSSILETICDERTAGGQER